MPTHLAPNSTPDYLLAELKHFIRTQPAELPMEAIERQWQMIELRAAQQEEHERFYRRPEYRANYKYWARRAWNNPEGTALSLGLEPRRVEWDTLVPFISVWQIAKDYCERSRELGELFPGPVGIPLDADQFIIQADGLGVEFPSELVAEVARVRPDSASQLQEILGRNLPSQHTQLSLKVKSLEQENRRLKRLIDQGEVKSAPEASRTDMLMDYVVARKFKFKLDARNQAASNVVNLLADHGLSMHRDTAHDRMAAAFRRFGSPKMTD